jgi:isopenicillin N synthase-like dioxygenase
VAPIAPAASVARTSELTDVVVLRYDDLAAGSDLTASISTAFGPDGLGILAVSGVPDVARQRQALLPLAPRFASMPRDVKAQYEHPESFWSFGWSHGKEKLQGRPDFAKGSYYNNPCENAPFKDPKIIKEFASFAHPNIWPTKHLPELEPAFMELGQTIVRVGKLVAKQCDRFVEKRSPAYAKGKLTRVLETSRVTKARLLHYFPPAAASEEGEAVTKKPEAQAQQPPPRFRGRSGSFSGFEDMLGKSSGGLHAADAAKADAAAVVAAAAAAAATSPPQKTTNGDDEFSSWCGWHNDHGSLTGLCPAMYFQEPTEDCPTHTQLAKNPCPSAGLYIRSRSGSLHQVRAPSTSCLLFQIGETSQIHSGGILQATPHAVKGSSRTDVCRSSFAVFMEPGWEGDMQAPADRAPGEAQSSLAEAALPNGVPPLKERWGTPGCPFTTCNFGEFTKATLGALH